MCKRNDDGGFSDSVVTTSSARAVSGTGASCVFGFGCGSRVAREFVYFLVVVSSNCQARWRGCSGVWTLLGAFHVWQLEAALEFLWGSLGGPRAQVGARVLGTYPAR